MLAFGMNLIPLIVFMRMVLQILIVLHIGLLIMVI